MLGTLPFCRGSALLSACLILTVAGRATAQTTSATGTCQDRQASPRAGQATRSGSPLANGSAQLTNAASLAALQASLQNALLQLASLQASGQLSQYEAQAVAEQMAAVQTALQRVALLQQASASSPTTGLSATSTGLTAFQLQALRAAGGLTTQARSARAAGRR